MTLPDWPTIWAAIGALATVTAFYFPSRFFWKRKKKRFHIFLSMQMSQLSDDEYVKVRKDIMKVVYELRKHDEVFFLNETIQHPSDFDEKKFDADEYLDEIRRSDCFIAILTDRVFSSIYFEAGYAMAIGKRSFYFVINEKTMPIIMRTAVADHPNYKVFNITTLDDISIRMSHLLRNSRNQKDI